MTIWRMRIACWITEATSRHSEYVIIIALTLKQWCHQRICMLRYTSIACLVGQKQVVSEDGGRSVEGDPVLSHPELLQYSDTKIIKDHFLC